MAEGRDVPFSEIISMWTEVVTVQMHFNEMLLRTRALGASVVVAFYGAAAVSLAQYPAKVLLGLHVAAFVVGAGLLLLLAVHLMDRWYYYPLLLGAVAEGEALEKEAKRLPQLTTSLSALVSQKQADCIVVCFYLIPAITGALFFSYLAVFYEVQ